MQKYLNCLCFVRLSHCFAFRGDVKRTRKSARNKQVKGECIPHIHRGKLLTAPFRHSPLACSYERIYSSGYLSTSVLFQSLASLPLLLHLFLRLSHVTVGNRAERLNTRKGKLRQSLIRPILFLPSPSHYIPYDPLDFP